MNRRAFLRYGVGASLPVALSRGFPANAWGAPAQQSGKQPIVDAEMRGGLLTYFQDICDWIMTLDVGGGTLKNTKDTRTSIFINGNFARVLMASHAISGNEAHRKEALRWCDTFCDKQQRTKSSRGNEAGFWGDCSPTGNIYFGDAGTAATALAIGHRYADTGARKKRYLDAMHRYVRFVTEGCAEDPQGKGREVTSSWVIRKGKAKGALGCGYYRGKLSTEPYTIASATTGTAFFSTLYGIEPKPLYKEVAGGAARWLLTLRKPDGEIIYTLAGKTLDSWPLDTLSYCVEGFVAADRHLDDPELKALLRKGLEPTVAWLLRRQNADGSWGKLRSADQQRSPRSLTLLTWWYRDVDPTEAVAQSVHRYCSYLLKPANSTAYGVKQLVRTTGFVGLAVAEVLKPGCTF